MADGNIPFVDQGVINAVLSHYILPLPPEFNFFSYKQLQRRFQAKKLRYIKVRDKAYKDPIIIHFTGAQERPWIEGNYHPTYQNEYMKYRSMTPWNNTPKRFQNDDFTHSLSKISKIKKLIKSFLPKQIYKLLIYNRIAFNNIKYIYTIKNRMKVLNMKIEDFRF